MLIGRTLVWRERRLVLWAGCGLVSDFKPNLLEITTRYCGNFIRTG